MIHFSFNIGCSESKVIFKRRKKQTCQIKMLYREQTFSPRAFHSELHQQTNTVNTQKSPPWACGKGCAEACAKRFSALKSLTGLVSLPHDVCVTIQSEQRTTNHTRESVFSLVFSETRSSIRLYCIRWTAGEAPKKDLLLNTIWLSLVQGKHILWPLILDT